MELIERNGSVGGKVVPGSVPKVKFDYGNYLDYLSNEVKESEKMPNFNFNLNTEATPEWLKEQNYDAVVFAYGTSNINPKIPGIDKVKTVQATDLLLDGNLLDKTQKIVVIGDGVVGCETAYWLKYEKNLMLRLWRCCRILWMEHVLRTGDI